MPHLYQDFNENLDKALAISLYYDHHPEKVRNAIGRSIKKFYFDNKGLTEETHQNLTNVRILNIDLNHKLRLKLFTTPPIRSAVTRLRC